MSKTYLILSFPFIAFVLIGYYILLERPKEQYIEYYFLERPQFTFVRKGDRIFNVPSKPLIFQIAVTNNTYEDLPVVIVTKENQRTLSTSEFLNIKSGESMVFQIEIDQEEIWKTDGLEFFLTNVATRKIIGNLIYHFSKLIL